MTTRLLTERDRRDIARFARDLANRDRSLPRQVRALIAERITQDVIARWSAENVAEVPESAYLSNSPPPEPSA